MTTGTPVKAKESNLNVAATTGERFSRMMPFPRDGHTGVVHDGRLVVFGGDRYQMPFNDTFIFDLKDELTHKGLDK